MECVYKLGRSNRVNLLGQLLMNGVFCWVCLPCFLALMYVVCNSDTDCCVGQLLHLVFQRTNVPLLQHTDMCQAAVHSAY